MKIDRAREWRGAGVALFPMTPDKVSDAYLGWLADPEVNQFLESRFVDQDRAAVERFVSDIWESDVNLLLGIRSDALGTHVGNIKLGPIDRRHRLAEIGIMIGDRAAWGRGIGREAITLIADIARTEFGLRKLSAGCYASNAGSRKAFEHAGFAAEGLRPAHCLLNGVPEDVVLLGRLLNPVEER